MKPRGARSGKKLNKDKVDLYLDMDGVLVSLSKERCRNYPTLVPDAHEFLEWAQANFNVLYLTCWTDKDFKGFECSRGLPKFIIMEWRDGIHGFFNKVNGIDTTRKFFWLEDGCTKREMETLKALKIYDNYVNIDPYDDEALTKWMMKMKKEGYDKKAGE